MKKAFGLVGKIFVFLTLAAALMITVPAAGVGFSASPVLPENQRDAGNGYFDLIMKPGQKQNLVVNVTNKSDEEIAVSVEAATASTNLNGIIDYTSSGISDETLKYSLADMAKVVDAKTVIPPDSVKEVEISVTMPDEEFDGVILGSVRVVKELTDEEMNSGGMIINRYSYVIAVRLQQNEKEIAPDFKLGGVTAELVNYRAAIVANVRNPVPIVVKGAKAAARIYPKGDSEPVFEYSMDEVDFAPNSIFPFSLVDDAGYGIKAGTYLAKISLEYEGKSWDFEEEFEVKQEEAARVNDEAVNQGTQQRQIGAQGLIFGLPVWAVAAIAAGTVILVLIVVIIIVLARRAGEDDDNDEEDDEDDENDD